MLNGVAGSAIAVALAATVGASMLLKPSQRPHEEAAFLERVAVKVERAHTLAPETRDYLSALAARYAEPVAESANDLRRRRAVARLSYAIRQKAAFLDQ